MYESRTVLRNNVNITRRKRSACCVTKAIDTHADYVVLNAFPLQQWLQERAPVLHWNVACLVNVTWKYRI